MNSGSLVITSESAVNLGGVSEQISTTENTKSGQEVAKRKLPKSQLGKTDVRYWEKVIFHCAYTRDGIARTVTEWAARIQHLGRREVFSLGGLNKAAAAVRAKEIYLSLQSSGWDATLAKFKPKAEHTAPSVATVGEFLAAVKASATGRPKTVEGYCRAFRTIVADVAGIDGGVKKFDYRGGGRAAWLKMIGAVRLESITPEAVQRWKARFLKRAGADPMKARAARISANSLMQQAKNLFAAKMQKLLFLPTPLKSPFASVEFEPRQSMRYRSGFDVQEVISAAMSELPSEEKKVFLLAVMAGLRRNEIDKLEWVAFRWADGVIRVEVTRYFEPKSETSAGDIEVDAEVMELFRLFNKEATGEFVIESSNLPRPGATYTHYRCERIFESLTKWLRHHGVSGNMPLHKLRKEYGSQMCAKHGIYAASRALRHADIGITSKHYLDKKVRATVGMGHFLTPRP